MRITIEVGGHTERKTHQLIFSGYFYHKQQSRPLSCVAEGPEWSN